MAKYIFINYELKNFDDFFPERTVDRSACVEMRNVVFPPSDTVKQMAVDRLVRRIHADPRDVRVLNYDPDKTKNEVFFIAS